MSTLVVARTRSAIRVSLDREFMKGTRGPGTDPFYVDYPQMSANQRKTLQYLVKQVLNQIYAEVKNKPSYVFNSGNIIPDTELYQEFDLWHYHSGSWVSGMLTPYYSSNHPGHTSAIDLQLNMLGKTSAPCIHYVWESATSVRIVAYSAVHTPFPKETDPSNTLLYQLIDALP